MALPPPTLEEYKALRRSGISHDDIVARMQGATPTFTGSPDEPLQDPPIYADPVSLAAGLINPPSIVGRLGGRAVVPLATEAAGVAGRLGARVVEGGAGLTARLAKTPIIRNIPFMKNAAGIAEDVGSVAGLIARLGQQSAPIAADEAATAGIGSAAARIAPPITRPINPVSGLPVGRGAIARAAAEDAAAGEARAAAQAAARAEGKTVVAEHTRALPKVKPRRGPEVGSAASRSQRGASKPELARRAKDLERAKARRAPKVQELEDKTGKVIAKIVPAKETGSAASRHQVQYFSESAKKYVDIEKMNQKHIESAFRKLSAKNPKPGSVGRRVLDALLEESKHRLKTTGIHIGQ